MEFIFTIGNRFARVAGYRSIGTRRCISRCCRLYRVHSQCNTHGRRRIPVAGKYTTRARSDERNESAEARKRRESRVVKICRCGTTLPRQIIAPRSLSTAGRSLSMERGDLVLFPPNYFQFPRL